MNSADDQSSSSKIDRLIDFKPLERVRLPGIGELDCRGLLLVVGPNASGKSQFLQDLHLKITGQPRDLVVADEIILNKPQYDPLVQVLRGEGYIEPFKDTKGTNQFRVLTPYIGAGQGAGLIEIRQAKSWHESFDPSSSAIVGSNVPFLDTFGRMMVTALFLDRRLALVAQVGSIDYETDSPQNDIQALYVNDAARDDLAEETARTFGQAVWPDASRGKILCLRVSDSTEIPVAEDRLSPMKMSTYRTVETEGDGMRSYVGIAIALLLGRRPVCLIDEPEMCLHPPQAFNLGRLIGSRGTSSENVTFVATHSSHILRGAVQATDDLQIIRLTNSGGSFRAHHVPADALQDALKKPTMRAETVLDGIFAQAVVVVEADSDRVVYQATWESLSSEDLIDIHFAPVGGLGGVADTCRLYRTLDIPIAVIADLDVITDPDQFHRIVSTLTNAALASALNKRAQEISEEIKQVPPNIDPDQVKSAILQELDSELDWTHGDDHRLRRVLNKTSRQLDRMRKLKSGGIDSLPESTSDKLGSLISDLGEIGLFLVPVGELEEWLSGYDVAASKKNKWAWANAAATIVRSSAKQEGDIWDFISDIGKFLETSLQASQHER